MAYTSEAKFEEDFCKLLQQKGWKDGVLMYPSESDLIQNWAEILFAHNKEIDRLNNCPLTDSEMAQLLDKIEQLKTPLQLNGFINGKTVSIKRDNPEDKLHFGKEVSLKIFDRYEIAQGATRYQIARQPKFRGVAGGRDRRGDVMLLINGMPIFHIELKRSGVHVSQAYNQIEKYSRQNVFSGLFSLVQIFVAMNPEESVYFANPGPGGRFNSQFYFHWADEQNNPVNAWHAVTEGLLSIPMAHQMLGFYTVADGTDGLLKVMRSYQYRAARAISDAVELHKGHWDEGRQQGGYIWHTTGSGKTMTSFKAAQLIAMSKSADKVVFLTDRVELGTQSLQEYKSFADDNIEVHGTENTDVLVDKLKSKLPSDILVVTSIQKMFRMTEDAAKVAEVSDIAGKRMVIIVDEAHRSTFGNMLYSIKKTFPKALLFGFTGTPILEENQKKECTTEGIFGRCLHRYNIAEGMRDKNVLGFDVTQISTFRDSDLRREIALREAGACSEEEAMADEAKQKVYLKFMSNDVPMAGYTDAEGKDVRGIEDYLDKAQYRIPTHQKEVVSHICRNWLRLSRNNKFHAIFATSSIPEAIEYYHLFREMKPELKVTALYEPSEDNKNAEFAVFKEEETIKILDDYSKMFNKPVSLSEYGKFKKDLSHRLAHKEEYKYVDKHPEQQLDLLIVVSQMLTGFDSKWVNTLYLDKVMEYEQIIQAFSRTNRLFGPEKPFGNIYYYRKPHTMKRNIDAAMKLYSSELPTELFVSKLPKHVAQMNTAFNNIKEVFMADGKENFAVLPSDTEARAKFAKEFRILSDKLEAAKVQGFDWDVHEYRADNGEVVTSALDEKTYLVLAKRYKELAQEKPISDDKDDVILYPIAGYLTEIDTSRIDYAYLNACFVKYVEAIRDDAETSEKKETLRNDLHGQFKVLTLEEQRFADIFLRDLDRGVVQLHEGKTFRDYVAEYMDRAMNDGIHKVASDLGLDEQKLRALINVHPSIDSLNLHERFDELCETCDIELVKAYFNKPAPYRAKIAMKKFVRDFILSGGVAAYSYPQPEMEVIAGEDLYAADDE